MTNHPEHRGLQIDTDRAACLCDHGAPGYHAAIGIGPDGTEHALIIDTTQIGHGLVDFTCPDAPHDQTNRPPPTYVDQPTDNHRRRPKPRGERGTGRRRRGPRR